MPYFVPNDTALELLAKLITVDGSGSGLDADTVDGLHASSLSVGGSTTQVQYNNSGVFAGDSGLVYDDVNDALSVLGRINTPIIRPIIDSTSGFQIQTLAGNTLFIADTTNSRIGIGITPLTVFHARTSTANAEFRFQNIADTGSPLFSFHRARGSIGSETPIVNGARLGELQFVGYGTSGYFTGGFLRMVGNATWSNTSAPTDFHVMLAPSGTITPVERLTVKSSGLVGISTTSPTAWLHLPASTTTIAALRFVSGAVPTSPNDGEVWFDGTNLYIRIGGITKTFTVT